MPLCSAVVLVHSPACVSRVKDWLATDTRFTVGPVLEDRFALVIEGASTAEIGGLLQQLETHRSVACVWPVYHAFADEPEGTAPADDGAVE